MLAEMVEIFPGVAFDKENKSIHIDLTQQQIIRIVGFNRDLKPKEYILKVTGRGLVIV